MVFEARLSDCSRFRPIPDHQEVFSDADSDQSLIVEILELPYAESHGQVPANFHFQSLAKDNAATAASITATPILEEVALFPRGAEQVQW